MKITVPKSNFLGTDIYSLTIIFIGEYLPPLQLLSETLHAATPIRISISAFNTTLSPAVIFYAIDTTLSNLI